jgi:5S rRNA maturation endonuclease (ribonuclease M5)
MTGPEGRYQQFVEFLMDFIRELNHLSGEGAVVLVEGRRDAAALAELGFVGEIITSATLASAGAKLRRAKIVIILTDLDTEGRRLASRYIRLFSRMGVQTTLTSRRRLSKASRGKFLHVENLIRFAPLQLGVDSLRREPGESSRPD